MNGEGTGKVREEDRQTMYHYMATLNTLVVMDELVRLARRRLTVQLQSSLTLAHLIFMAVGCGGVNARV